MIIGHGSIASMLTDRQGAIFFAAGVSNSQCINRKEFDREIELLRTIKDYDQCLFYFSTISRYFVDSPYVRHKMEMEIRIRSAFRNCNIVRIGNVWECTNPNTFINSIRKNNGVIRDEYKYMIHASQLNMICQSLPLTGHNEICVFTEMKKVKECL
jgi:UDP-2-acetamido-2,6-beta-L-arabino-hexul-4-ose reductase